MNALDGVVVVVVLLAGIGGWRFGFVARVLAWCGKPPVSTEDVPMTSTTTQRYGTAAVAVARARYAHVVANDLMDNTMGSGSWSSPCTAPATFHKPRPRRPQVISS